MVSRTTSRGTSLGVGVWAMSLSTFLAAAAIGAVALRLEMPSAPITIPWWLLAAALMAAELRQLEFRTQRDMLNISLSDLPVVIGLVFTPLAEVWIAITVGMILAEVVRRRRPSVKWVFNVGLGLTTSSVMALLLRLGLQQQAPDHASTFPIVLVAVTAAAMVGQISLIVILHLAGATTDRPTRTRAMATTMVVAATTSAAAMVAIDALWGQRPVVWPLLLLTGLAVAAYRGYSRLRRSHESLRVLHRFTTASLHARDRDDSAASMMAAIRDELRCEHLELVLHDQHAAVHMWLRVGPDGEVVHLNPALGTNAAHWWAVRRAAEEASLHVGGAVPRELTELLADLCVVDAMVAPLPLSRRERLSGLVVAVNRLGQASPFDAAGLEMLTTLVGHATVALENGRLMHRLREEAEEREHAALHDALTGLPNRRLLTSRIDLALRSDAPGHVGVMLMDLDRFKDINDTLGHHIGDLLLQEVGRRVREAVRPGDLVARLGGDEFAVLISDIAEAGAAEVVATRIEDALSMPCQVGDVNIALRASVGIALSPDHGVDASSLLRSADVAMYRAKASGGGHRLYSPEHDHHTPRLLSLAADLRTAISAREVTVHFQPKICIRTGRVTGAEALARWTHPTEGFIPPDQFVAVAEDHGIIDDLTTLVIREALDHAGAWKLAGHPLEVAVNLSPRTVVDTTFPERLQALLAEALVDAPTLTLEVTESSMLSDPDTAVEVLNQLAALGVKISIDDFGTGFSSLSYLKRLPATEVKIDRAFVGTMTTETSDEVIVRSVVDLGHNLGMLVVAEGVEDQDTVDGLALLGCDVAQGYAFSRPVPPEEFMRLLRSGELHAQGLALTQRTAA